jgi:SAM-dependent methyltransferase
MNGIKGLSLRRVINGAKVLAQGPPRCLKEVRALIRDKRGIEIGGPSAVFRNIYNLPVYDVVASLDNCDFSQNTKWAAHTAAYQFSKKKPSGKTYISEGSQLGGIPENEYDFLLSSHNLEHFANPIKGLKEWQRVVKPGGHLIVVLPHYARTFDRRRVPTTLQHMVQDFERDTGEDDLTHMEETLVAHRLNDPSRSDEELRTLLLSNFSHRMMHHHVFNETNSRELLEAVGFEVLAVETQRPFHIYLVARTPR